MDGMSFDKTIQIVQEHKFKSIEIFNRNKMLNRKARMNIPLCRMISMPIVCLAFKIDVLKMEQAFQTGYREGDKAFYISPLNCKRKEEFLDS
jgi:hypothetical protein